MTPKHSAKRRIAVAAAPVALVGAIVLGTAVPAWAHHPILSGETVCSNGDHLVTWSIGNSESNHTMTFDSISASIGADTYTVTGYTTPIAASGSTNAQTIVPGNVSGTITLDVHVRWNDGFTAEGTTSVDLIGPCEGASSTTTSSVAPTSTTSSSVATQTTFASTTTSTLGNTGSTVTTAPTPTTLVEGEGSTVSTTVGASIPESIEQTPGSSVESGSGTSLPFTGSSAFGPLAGLGSLVAGGAALLYGTGRKRRR